MPIQIADLVAKVSFKGKQAIAGMQRFAGATRKTGRNIQNFSHKTKIQLQTVTKTWQFLGKASTGALGSMIASTPLLQAQLAMLSFQFYELWRTLGEQLAPILEVIVEWVTKAVEWFKTLDPKIVKVIAVVLGLVSAFVALAPLLKALPALFSPISLAIAGIILVLSLLKPAYEENIGGFRDFVDGFVTFFKDMWASLKEPLEELWIAFKDLFLNKIIPMLEKQMPKIQLGIENIIEILGLLAALISGDVGDAFLHLGHLVENVVEGILNTIRNMFKSIGGWFNDFMQHLLHPEDWFSGDNADDYFQDLTDLFPDWYDPDAPYDPFRLPPTGGGAGGTAGTEGASATVNVYNDITIHVDASGSTADAYDIATKTSEVLADELSNVQNW